MNELIDRLVNEAKLTPEQAHKAVETVANFVKDRFPMLGGAVDQVFGAGNKNDDINIILNVEFCRVENVKDQRFYSTFKIQHSTNKINPHYTASGS
jgi:polyhydroxyalkanoate synthesis regulator phasin